MVRRQLKRRRDAGNLRKDSTEHACTAPAVAQVVQRDGAQPGFRVVEGLEPPAMADCLDERLLHGILGLGLVTAEGKHLYDEPPIGGVEHLLNEFPPAAVFSHLSRLSSALLSA